MTYPSELNNYNAWVCWRYEKVNGSSVPTKVPYNPASGMRASSTDPGTWANHQTALAAAAYYSGVGFSLSDNDPYTFIDLDDPFKRKDGTYITDKESQEYKDAENVWRSHWQIAHEIASYTEWSPSGRGLRIIIKGKLPPGYRNRVGKVEIYSRERYMTITGNRIELFPGTIEDRQGTLETLCRVLCLDSASQGPSIEDQAETRDDAAVVSAAFSGGTGEAFAKLWHGDITAFPSGSEADLAFANYICFQTDNRVQAERIFRSSPYFAARPKLHDRADLISKAINKGFDRKAPPIDTSKLLQNMQAVANSNTPKISPTRDPLLQTLPDGMLGQLAQFLYEAAPRPVREIALAGAIAFLAGVTGRAFNINGTGLNQYVVLLSESGSGKEAISSGVSKIMPYLKQDMEAAELFLGPSMIASAPALYKQFATRSKSFASIIPEFGRWMRIHMDDRANSTSQGLVLAILDLWTKSGKGATVRESVYSDKTKDVAALDAPAFTFIGESVPHEFYPQCTQRAIEGGLIPRMLLIEYTGPRVPLNEASFGLRPSADLILTLKSIVQISLINQNRNDPTGVLQSEDAHRELDNFNKWCDAQINGSPSPIIKALYNRSHLKALKLAAIIAVGKNWLKPQIELADAMWAIAHVKEDASKLLSRFETGDLSSGHVDDDKERAVIKCVSRFFAPDFEIKASHNIPAHVREHGLIPVSYIRNLIKSSKCFKGSNASAQDLINKTLKEMSENGLIGIVKTGQLIPGTGVVLKGDCVAVLQPEKFAPK